MDISSIRLSSLPPTGTEARARVAWQAGEILEATVVVSQVGRLTLELGGTRVQAQSGLQFSPGQHLRLQVTEPGEQPVLRLLEDAPDPRAVQGRTLRMALPQQGPLAPVLDSLTQLAQSALKAGDGSLPSVLSSLAVRILARLPQAGDLGNPAGLKQAMQESGLFLEAHLAALPPGTPPAADLKADLLRLEAATAGTLTGLADKEDATTMPSVSGANFLHAIQGALARLEVNQINLLGGGILTLELPIRRGEEMHTLTLTVEEGEESPDGDGGALRPWTATLRFDLEGLGPVSSRVMVTNKVSVSFQTERPEASQALGSRLEELRTALTAAGLTPGRLSAYTGPPPALPRRQPAMPLLDLRA
ncbi:conserved hypothetical protein [Gammaproteobacteria bacterium]